MTSLNGHSNGESSTHRQKILVLGGKKVGKTCCIQSAFRDLRPEDAIYVDMTTKVEKVNYDSAIPLQLIDTPGNFDIAQLAAPGLDLSWRDISMVVYVVDMLQLGNSGNDVINHLGPIFVAAYAQNPAIHFDVFLHKGDALHVDHQYETYQEFTRDATDYFLDFDAVSFFAPVQPPPAGGGTGAGPSSAPSSATTATSPSAAYLCPPFHLPRDQLDELMDALVSQLRFTLTSVWDFSVFEGWSAVLQRLMEGVHAPLETLMNDLVQNSEMDRAYLFDVRAKVYLAKDASLGESRTFTLCSDFLKRRAQFEGLYANVAEARRDYRRSLRGGGGGEGDSTANGDEEAAGDEDAEDEEERDWPFQVARIGENSSIAYWQFTDNLALICKMRSDVLKSRKGMIEYNVTLLRRGVMQILEAVSANEKA